MLKKIKFLAFIFIVWGLILLNIKNPAGFWVRFFANLVDSVILAILVVPSVYLVYGEIHSRMYTPFDLVNLLYAIVLPIVWSGYTIGKRAFNIRIARVDGQKVTLGTMLMRQIVAGIVYGLTLGIAMIVSAFMVGLRRDKRAIHDFIAGTYVTYDSPEVVAVSKTLENELNVDAADGVARSGQSNSEADVQLKEESDESK